MSPARGPNARTVAFDILMRVERERSYAADLLHSAALEKLSPLDRGLCTEMVMGVLRWQAFLDAQFAGLLPRPLAKLDREVLIALRMGTYQVVFLGKVPMHAAVHETVQLVKRARKTSAAGLVNAILHRMADNKGVAAEFVGAGAAGYRDQILQAIRREPQHAAKAVAAATSHPEWLVERWLGRFGVPRTVEICVYDQAPPPAAIRITASATDEEVRREGIEFAPGALVNRARRLLSGNVTATRAFREGRVAFQDEASQLVALLVGKGERILDCCAAPGGKTVLLAEQNPGARVVAIELYPHRARLLRSRATAPNVEVVIADVTGWPGAQDFDRVLADVPCSGTGTLARNPEIKWRLTPADLDDLHGRQVAILRAALEHAAPGARIVYSTCSLEREENEDVVEAVLRDRSDTRLLSAQEELERLSCEGELAWQDVDSLVSGSFLRTLPGVHPCDGFFAAIFEKRAS